MGQERAESLAPRDVEEAVGPAFGHAGDVGRGDGEEVEHVAERRPVEIAVGLNPAVARDHGVVDGCGQLAARHQRGVVDRVPGRPGDLRSAAQRVRVLHARCIPGPDGWP